MSNGPFYSQVSFTLAAVVEGRSGVTRSFLKSLRHQSSIWLLFHPAGFHHTGMPAMRSRGTSRTPLLFVGRYKACRHHEQMLAPAVRLQWPSARFSRGSSCLLKMLVDYEALGQSDCRWTLEWLNKSRRRVSLLWVSPVSHLFIAPLSLISSHCLWRLA